MVLWITVLFWRVEDHQSNSNTGRDFNPVIKSVHKHMCSWKNLSFAMHSHQVLETCKNWGSHSSVATDSSPLGRYARTLTAININVKPPYLILPNTSQICKTHFETNGMTIWKCKVSQSQHPSNQNNLILLQGSKGHQFQQLKEFKLTNSKW
jgi:competence transcription factor ComK